MKLRNFFILVLFVGLSELAGIIGSMFTVSAIPGWYSTLLKPALNPPSWIFGPVWITLYVLMGIAAFLVWRTGWKKRPVRVALMLFGLQLFLNTIWSIIFFGLHSPLPALVDIILLWLAIIATMVSFYKISRAAAFLLVPYLFWVTFATYLNCAFWILNT